MKWMYDLFDWTWHLSSLGGFLWMCFMAAIAVWYMIGLFVVLANYDELINPYLLVAIYVCTPVFVLLGVGYVGYLIHGGV